MIVPKRVQRRAVDRNLVKRLVRAVFQEVRPGLAGVDVIVQLVKPCQRSTRRDLRVELQGLFGRLGECGT